MKKTLLAVAFIVMATLAFAGHGYYADGGSFVNFNPNGAGFTNYKVSQCNTCGALPNFSGTSLGTNLTSLILGNIEQNTYENGGDDVLDHGSFYYVIYPTGSRPASPVYTAVLLSTAIYNNGGPGNERRSMNPNTQLINGLANTTNYTIEVYYQNPVTYNGGSTGHTISPATGGGTNYDAAPTLFTATFTTGNVLAANSILINSSVQNNNIVISWAKDDQAGVAKYSVERSANGINFNELTTVMVTANKNYFYTDNNPVPGPAYYRIKITYISGQIIYSDIINAVAQKGVSEIAILAVENNIKLTLKNIPANNYGLSIINNSGQQVYYSPLPYDGLNKTVPVLLPSALPQGIYRVVLRNNKNVYSGSFIK